MLRGPSRKGLPRGGLGAPAPKAGRYFVRMELFPTGGARLDAADPEPLDPP